jgi:hypothetical protein
MIEVSYTHEDTTYTATLDGNRVEIYAGHVWAGSGAWGEGDVIEDCGAVLGGDQDTAEVIYRELEELIAAALRAENKWAHYCRECGVEVDEYCAEHPGAIVDSALRLLA